MDILILRMPKICPNFSEIHYSQLIKCLRLIKKKKENSKKKIIKSF